MASQGDSLSVLQSVAANPAAVQPATPGQDSLSVLQSVAGNAPIKMVGQDGATQQIPQNQVADMRQKNFAVTPDNPDVQKVVTADGKLAYVLPGEVQKFEDSGATSILPDGRFTVKNLRSDGSEFPDSVPDVRQRAVNVARALGSEQMQRSISAEQNYWTSKEGLTDEAKGLGNVALAGAGTLATLAAPAAAAKVFGSSVVPVAGGAGFGGAAAGEIVGPSVATQAATWVGRQLLQHSALTAITGGGLLTKVLHWW